MQVLPGETMADNELLLPTATEAEVGVTDTPVTAILVEVTETVEDAVYPPSCVVTVIVVKPAPTPVTRPLELTVATFELAELHVTF